MRRVRYTVSTRRPTFLIDRLIATGLLLDEIERRAGEIVFTVDYRHSSYVEEVLASDDVLYRRSGYLGVRSFFSRIFSRPVLVISLVLSICLVIFFEGYVCNYTIKGNDLVNTALIESVLREKGAIGMVRKRCIDTDELRRSVGEIEGISFASVRVTGNRLVVEVKEELPHTFPVEPRYDPITSLYTAVVTRVVTESGTPVVHAGDRVSQNDLLIAPIYRFTEGESPAPARGEVWGYVTYEKEVILPSCTVESVLTGEVWRTRSVSIFGRSVGKETPPPFDEYDLSERILYRGIGVAVREKVYRRRSSATIYHDFDTEAPRLIESALAELLVSVPFHARERGEVVSVQKKVDNIFYLVLYYTVEQRIDPTFAARSSSTEGYG